MEIKGVLAVVTGAGSGLGRAVAALLAKAGARLALVDLDLARAKAAADDLGEAALPYGFDVADARTAEAAFATIARTQGAVRILVNCAGIAPGAKIVGKDGPMPLDAFVHGVNVNLIGTFNTLRLAAFAMSGAEPLVTGERGVIVNTASVAAFEGQVGQASYAASKGGVAALTLPAARELAAHGIRVVAIAPGLFRTPMMEGLPEKVKAGLAGTVPFPSRLGEPEEFAALVRHIVENPMLNGEVIRLDGALRMAAR